MSSRQTRWRRAYVKAIMPAMEEMEGRVMLSGVTIITHGGLTGGGVPLWTKEMAGAVESRIGAGVPVARYVLTVESDDEYTLIQEGTTGTLQNPATDFVVIVDWTALNRWYDPGKANDAGRMVAKALLNPPTDGSFAHSLAELPLHFISHSRGAYVDQEAIKVLGEAGVWVDQNTTLDAQGEVDWGFSLNWANVRFADNYYQQDGIPDFDVPEGFSIDGTEQRNLTGQSGFVPFQDTDKHSRVHTWYFGTVNLDVSTDTDLETIRRSEWYGTNPRVQPATGFYFSQYAGGIRPNSGLRFGGATRAPLSVSSLEKTPWDDIEIVNLLQYSTFVQGNDITVHAQFEDIDKQATITLALDSDTNPYNNAFTAQGYATAALQNSFLSDGRISTTGIAPGDYHVVARISGAHTRYIYARGIVTINAAPPPPDTTAPTASLAFPANPVAQSTVNADAKHIDVTFSDASGIDAASILDSSPEFTLSGTAAGGVSVSTAAPMLQGSTTTTATYRYLLTGGGFGLGPVTLNFTAGAFRDAASVPNSNAPSTLSFTIAAKPVITDVNPKVLQPLSAVQTQLITLSGTGFSAQSTLTFVSANKNIFSGRPASYNTATGTLSYYVSVGTTEGQWSVTVSTNGVDSDPAYFNVSSLTPAATPTISPNGGSFSNSVAVSLVSATSGATIRYTLDGTDPTASSSIYSSALTLSTSATLKARAFKIGLANSAVSSATFNVTVTPAAPAITSVSPALLQPSNNIQQISIYGSGFLPSCLLYFYDPSGNLVQNNQTVFVTSGRVDYGLGVNAKSGIWTVKVVNDPYGSPSPSNLFSFTVATPPAGNYPTQLLPANGATGVIDRPTVSWQPIPGATFYRVMVAKTPDLPRDPNAGGLDGSIAQWISSTNDSTTTSMFIGAFGLTGKTYYWQVQANINGVNQVWSPIWNYTLAGELNLPPIIQSASVSPATVTQGGTVTFTANGVSDPNLPPDRASRVQWFLESNGIPGLQTSFSGGDTIFAVDNDGTDGWASTNRVVKFPFGGIDPGTYTMYGVAIDTKEVYSLPSAPFTFTVLPANVPTPTIQAVVFDPSTAPTLKVVFNTDVSFSLAANRFMLFGPGNPSIQNYSYDAATNTALLSLGTTSLLNGDYQLWIPFPTNVYNVAGVTLQGSTAFNFTFMAADANLDRSVDFLDLALLAQNYNILGGKGWADGDFNGDGNVDFLDLAKLAQNYNTSLPGAAVPSAASLNFQQALAAAFAPPAPETAPVKPKPALAIKPAPVTASKPKLAPVQKPKPTPALRPSSPAATVFSVKPINAMPIGTPARTSLPLKNKKIFPDFLR